MTEFNPHPYSWDRFKNRFEPLTILVRAAADRMANQIRYQLRTSPEERRQASVDAEAFSADTVRFIMDNDIQKLFGPMNLTNPQLAIIDFLLEQHKKNKFPLIDTYGRVNQVGTPYIIKLMKVKLEKVTQ